MFGERIFTSGYAAFIILIVIIILIWHITCMNVSPNEDYLYGLWTGNDEFCEDAEIDSMLIMIGEPEYGLSSVTRNGYIVIQSDNVVVCDQGFVLKYNKGWAGPYIGKYTICGTIDFDEEQIWTENGKIKITTDMKTGIMRVHYHDQLYAKLYKSMEMSAINTI